MDQYEIEILNKIDMGEKLSEKELKMLCYEFNEVERNEGENRRWSRSVVSIIKIGERFFKLVWEEGLTESQENEFYNQPYEVIKNTYEKTVTITEWNKKIK